MTTTTKLRFTFSPAEQDLLRSYGFFQRDIDGMPTYELIERIGQLCIKLREKGLAGHWTYSLPDHHGMIRIYKRGRAVLGY